MTEQQLINVVAKLDGFEDVLDSRTAYIPGDWSKLKHLQDLGCEPVFSEERPNLICCNVPKYLTSRDAIIPVICKQNIEVQRDVYRQLFSDRFESDGEKLGVRFTVSLEEIFHKTARDFSIALVKAAGKWEE